MKHDFKSELCKMFPGAVTLTPAETAEALGTSERHIINAIENGSLVAINIGLRSRKHWRIPILSLVIYQEENVNK